jgi:tRNA(Ile)-lysidine synthase
MTDGLRDISAFFSNENIDISKPIGLAVSGGGDSMALLRALATSGLNLRVATVDHALRDGSLVEAEQVAKWCKALNIPHDTLTWTDHGAGNLQNNARLARRALLTTWAKSHDIHTICLGHTQDDQAETFLMRLARGSGVDGLAAMYAKTVHSGLVWVRPLLNTSRADLRSYLQEIGQDWIDDPSNDNDQFDRIKMRQAKEALAALGLTAHRVGNTAAHMQNARFALESAAQQAAKCATPTEAGSVFVDRAAFLDLSEELRARVLVHALSWVAPTPYRPRYEAVQNLLSAIILQKGHTLAGCQTRHSTKNNRFEIIRELNGVQRGHKVGLFDAKWRVPTNIPAPLNVAPLGANGLLSCPDWRETGVSRAALITTPAIWDGIDLIAAPFAGKVDRYSFELESSVHEFLTSFVTH